MKYSNNQYNLLLQSANIAFEKSQELCEGCDYYHGLWQYLRLLEIMTPPYQDKGLYDEALKLITNKSKTIKILISGASDYGILEAVFFSIQQHDIKAEITVLDLCDTTLYINQWYAKKLNININTIKQDILTYTTNDKYDCIFSHSFLGRFDEKNQLNLMIKWNNLLLEDGIIATTSQIRVGLQGWQKFNEEQQKKYLTSILEKKNKFDGFVISEEILVEMVNKFTANFTTFSICDEESLINLIKLANFQIKSFYTKGKAANINLSPCTKGEKLKAYVIAQKGNIL